MSNLATVTIIGDGPIKDAAGLHGRDIGYVWASGNVEVTVDYDEEHDEWLPIVNPPTWRETKKQGWVKKSRTIKSESDVIQMLITYYPDGREPSVKIIK